MNLSDFRQVATLWALARAKKHLTVEMCRVLEKLHGRARCAEEIQLMCGFMQPKKVLVILGGVS